MTKKNKRYVSIVFFVILILHSLAIFLFTKGFLLTRTELNAYSQCQDLHPQHRNPCSLPPPPHPVNSTINSENVNQCWTKPAVDRLIIIVLDALRFDFVAPSTFFHGEEKKPWMDKLTVLQKFAASSSAKLFKAFADPPTTSLQRLKGLTTGSLPTFIDVGNSFGAPAIVEDNLMYQLAKNGKRVLMMGDDTWLQLFPDNFNGSYPYPSFNVKDLDTVDDGCIEHLFPSLYNDDWDVLIAHFLGVDHAGHIFGVDSAPMIQKLEQYNDILEKVIDVLDKHSGPGDLHENTYLIVMGDHGQTTNGDHGGGTPEEVETTLFAMSMKDPPFSVSSIFDSNSCGLNSIGESICISSIQQIDFAVTVSALLGIPFPFGSIGRVNPELYALSGGSWEIIQGSQNLSSDLELWMKNYAQTLCMNCWQVKRYVDLYSKTSAFGFPSDDLQRVNDLYTVAQESWSTYIINAHLDYVDGLPNKILPLLKTQINAYSQFLEIVAELARSKWTEFDLNMMGFAVGFLFITLLFYVVVILTLQKYYDSAQHSVNNSWNLSKFKVPLLLLCIRANSFLSNSYILTEGKVANFLLATTGIISTRNAVIKGTLIVEDIAFLVVCILLRFSFDAIIAKQATSSTFSDLFSFNGIISNGFATSDLRLVATEMLPVILLLLLVFLFYKRIKTMPYWRNIITFTRGAIVSYLLLAVHWVSESKSIILPTIFQTIGKTFVPQVIYSIGFLLLVLAIIKKYQKPKNAFNCRGILDASLAMMCAWSPTILMLLGRQSPIVASLILCGAWCIIRLQIAVDYQVDSASGKCYVDPLAISQWSLLAICLFFSTGHWCNFDGLRYGAAFIGFDHFNLFRQGALLAIDTFGVSHILPVLGLPILVALVCKLSMKHQSSHNLFWILMQAFLMFGFQNAVTTTLTVICVTIHRRHLMVWGLFAPKYVFDALGLLLTDALLYMASLYYF